MSDLLKGKRGLIMGLANDKSIAWGIARACHEAGAELAFTYMGDAFKKRVEPLAESINVNKIYDCDGCSVKNTQLMYPSTSKRSLGIAGESTDDRWVTRMDRCTNCLVDNCSFAHTVGSAIVFHGSA